MIANENQEKLVKEYLKYKVDDPLKYEEFKYPFNEWDNVPPIIPRFILKMNQHLKSLVASCSAKFHEESTHNLRKDFELQNAQLHAKIDKILEEQQDVNKRVFKNVSTIDNNHNLFKNKYDEFVKKNNDQAHEDFNSIMEK
jgi:hypothetical protein